MAPGLCEDGQKTGPSRQHDEGQFFDEQMEQASWLLICSLESSQWPEVQQDQGERRSHGHRFAHQRQRKDKQRDPIQVVVSENLFWALGFLSTQLHITRIRRNRCEPEKSAEQV